MTVDTEQASGTETPAYVSEAASRRGIAGAWSWLTYAPLERIPWSVSPIVWSAAEIFHALHLTWSAPALFTFAASCIAFGKASKKAARSENPELDGLEASLTWAVPGAWLTAATHWGPFAGHLIGPAPVSAMDLLAVGIFGFGPVWLRRHPAAKDAAVRRALAEAELAAMLQRRRELDRRKRQWHLLAPHVGLKDSHLADYELHDNGSETWEINTKGTGILARNVNFGHTAALIAGESPEILGGKPVPTDRVEVFDDPGRMPHKLFVRFLDGNRWADGGLDGILWHPLVSGELNTGLPGAEFFTNPAPSILDPICLGLDPETRKPMLLTLMDASGAHRILVLGTSGSGKSVVLDTIRERITACKDAVLILVNLSKGTEDKWWRNLTATDALTDDPDSEKVRAKALAILDFIFDVCNGSRPKPPGHRNHKPTSAEPAIVLMIDEVDMTTNDADRKEQLGLIASKCRSEGIILIIGSQRPFDKDLGGKTRAMLTDIVWGKLKARDLAQASGGLANLPDMNEYGQGNPGVFGIAPYPVSAASPVQRGRAFFWGEPSPGLISIIDSRAAALGGVRPYQQLDAGMRTNPSYVAQWAGIIGTATDEQHHLVTAAMAGRGHAASRGAQGELRKDRLAALAQSYGGDPAETSAPPAAPSPPAPAVPAPRAEVPAASAGPLPTGGPFGADDQAHLWELLNGTPGGISTRRPDNGGPLRRVNPGPGGEMTWNEEYVRRQLNIWRDLKLARLVGGGGEQRWVPVHLRVAPDPPAEPEPQTAVSASPEPEPQFTGHEAVMVAAGWILQASDGAGEARARAQLGDNATDQALQMIRDHRDLVLAELKQLVLVATTPPRRRPVIEDEDPLEDLDDEDLDDDGEDWETGP